MFLVGHTAAGALVGEQVATNPLMIFILAFASHFLLDFIPHGDRHHVVDYYKGKKKLLKQIYATLVIDSAASILYIVLIMTKTNVNRWAIAWGIFGSVLPDLLVGLAELLKNTYLAAFKKFHFIIHNALIHKIRVKPLPGTLLQIIVIAIMYHSL